MLRDMQAVTLPTLIDYPASDGEPMAETGVHITAIVYILSMLRTFFHRREDVYVSGDMLMYYEEGDSTKRVAPDAFVVFDTTPTERRSWFVWREGKAPDLVFEITSRGTRMEDIGLKKGLYQELGVREYFLFDPLDDYLRPRLQGFQLVNEIYQAIPLRNGELASPLLGLNLYAENGLLRFRDTRTGQPLLIPTEEAEARAEAEAEVARLRAELARLRGE